MTESSTVPASSTARDPLRSFIAPRLWGEQLPAALWARLKALRAEGMRPVAQGALTLFSVAISAVTILGLVVSYLYFFRT